MLLAMTSETGRYITGEGMRHGGGEIETIIHLHTHCVGVVCKSHVGNNKTEALLSINCATDQFVMNKTQFYN